MKNLGDLVRLTVSETPLIDTIPSDLQKTP